MVSVKYIIFIVLVTFLPWSLAADEEGNDKKLERFKINDDEWKKAQEIINKLVDESIEEHIKAKSQDYVKDLKKGCEDRIEHCDTLASAGVCKTSKKAMQKHCAKTCKLCESQFIQINPEVEIVMKPKTSKPLSFVKPKDKVDQSVKAAVLHNLFTSSHTDSLMEPLLSQQSSVAMKYHDNKDLSTENEKIRDAQKLLEYVKVLHVKKNQKPAAIHENAAKKHITKKPSKKSKTKKIHGVPMDNLAKTVTYKNQKYKITPVVDWKKISKMLKSLGYKAIHIVGMKNKHLEKGIKAHLRKNGVVKVLTGKKHKPHVANETFVTGIHRGKSTHNAKWYKENCHPFCAKVCLSSCHEDCCDHKVSSKTGLLTHCHPECKKTCVRSCGRGCCSPEEEKKRQYGNYLKDQPTVIPTKKKTETKPAFRLSDIHHDEKPHPPIVNPKLFSPELYKPQRRLCPGSCAQACAPACNDACCHFGEYAHATDALQAGRKHNPGLVPNVPFPHSNSIPVSAFRCKESCRFHCDSTCPDDCCQPEGLTHRAARLQLPFYYNAQQQPMMGYQKDTQNVVQGLSCPAACPSTCYPSCNPACCEAALGMPVDDQPDSRSSTRKVIHIQHILHPLDRKGLVPGTCPGYCGNHCTPVCARSGCCVK